MITYHNIDLERNNYNHLFLNVMVLICKTLSPFYLRMLYAKFGLNWPISSGEEFFIFCHYIYLAILWLSPLEKGPFLWINWNPHHPKMLCAKFGWNWLIDSGEFYFKISVNVFTLFRNYLPLEKGVTLYFNKFESPLPREALCQVWLKLTQWFYRFLISSMYFRYFLIISSSKRGWPFISTNLNEAYEALCQV